jgi:hypothetical protein
VGVWVWVGVSCGHVLWACLVGMSCRCALWACIVDVGGTLIIGVSYEWMSYGCFCMYVMAIGVGSCGWGICVLWVWRKCLVGGIGVLWVGHRCLVGGT